jgi:hypothetical protein
MSRRYWSEQNGQEEAVGRGDLSNNCGSDKVGRFLGASKWLQSESIVICEGKLEMYITLRCDGVRLRSRARQLVSRAGFCIPL